MNQQVPIPPSSELRTKLWAAMGFNSEDDPTYVSMRDFVACLTKIHLDTKIPYSRQDPNKLELVTQKALNEFPKLGTYKDHWAIIGLIRNSLYNKKRNDGQRNKRARGKKRAPLQAQGTETDGPVCGRAHEGARTQKSPEAVDSSPSTHSYSDQTYPLMSDPHQVVGGSSVQTRSTAAWEIVGYESIFMGIESSIRVIASIAHESGCQGFLYEYCRRQLQTIAVLQTPSFDIPSTLWIALIFCFCPASFSDEICDTLVHRILRLDTSVNILPPSLSPWEVFVIWLIQKQHPQALQRRWYPSITALIAVLRHPNGSLPLPSFIIQFWSEEELLCCPCPECQGEHPSTTTASLKVLLLLLQSTHLPSGEDILVQHILDTLISLAQVPMSQIRTSVAHCVEAMFRQNFHTLSQEQRHTCYLLLCMMVDQETLVYHKQTFGKKANLILAILNGFYH